MVHVMYHLYGASLAATLHFGKNNAELKVTNTRHALSAFLQTMRELLL